MRINTINKKTFEIADGDGFAKARMTYQSNDFAEAIIEISKDLSYVMKKKTTGVWITSGNKTDKVLSRIIIETPGLISVRLPLEKKKYHFKKSTGWKLRFLLVGRDGEELLSLIPSVNWQKESHDFILQINDEFEKECNAFLILQAVHCANCSLSMMTGGKVPALISI